MARVWARNCAMTQIHGPAGTDHNEPSNLKLRGVGSSAPSERCAPQIAMGA